MANNIINPVAMREIAVFKEHIPYTLENNIPS